MTLELALDADVCEVGGSFTGRLVRPRDEDGGDSRARSIRLGLQMRTAGRGDTDRSDIVWLTFGLDSDGGLATDFVIPVPGDVPVSYDGTLIRVMYEIYARLDLRMARDEKFSRDVLVVPVGGFGVYDRPHPLPRWT